MKQPYKEPEYLVLTNSEKKSITKRLLIIPIFCICFLLVMITGELYVDSPLPSFTKCKYFFAANRIVNDFCDGDTSSIVAHNLAYFDNGTLNYVYYNGVQDMYDDGVSLLDKIHAEFLKDELVISFVGMPHMQRQTHLNRFCDESDRAYIWRSIGYIFVGQQDVLQVDIQFLSPEIYYVFLSPTLPSTDEDSPESQQALIEYKNSPEFALLRQTQDYFSWMYNVMSSQSEDTVKYIENIFDKHNISATLLNQFITRYFTNKGNYLGQEFTDEIEKNYQHNFAWMLYSLAREITIIDSNLSYGTSDKTTRSISSTISLELKDTNGKRAHLYIPTLYTSAGYQIIDSQIYYIADYDFHSVRLPQLITFLQSDIMPEDILLERAAFELGKK